MKEIKLLVTEHLKPIGSLPLIDGFIRLKYAENRIWRPTVKHQCNHGCENQKNNAKYTDQYFNTVFLVHSISSFTRFHCALQARIISQRYLGTLSKQPLSVTTIAAQARQISFTLHALHCAGR